MLYGALGQGRFSDLSILMLKTLSFKDSKWNVVREKYQELRPAEWRQAWSKTNRSYRLQALQGEDEDEIKSRWCRYLPSYRCMFSTSPKISRRIGKKQAFHAVGLTQARKKVKILSTGYKLPSVPQILVPYMAFFHVIIALTFTYN